MRLTRNSDSPPQTQTQNRSKKRISALLDSLSTAHSDTSNADRDAMETAAAAVKLNSSSSVDYTPRSSPPSSLNRSPPPNPRSASPPTLVPSAMSMVSMASMLGGHHPPFGLPMGGYPGVTRDDFMHKFMDRSFGDSPPPSVPTNDPTANECKIVEYRGEKVAAFMIQGKTMLCLPQAFELFLKHLVGGLHTVYTKLKRLEITPIVCNVEQVRILRGLGAIQPGVNRCKLLADTDFDMLYKDCTTSRCSKPLVGISKSLSRPGRPPKRGVPFPPMSPQDAMLHLKQSMHNGAAAAGAAAAAGIGANAGSGGGSGGPSPGVDPTAQYAKDVRLDKSPFGNGFGPAGGAGAGGPSGPHGLNPMAAQFMALNHPAAFLAAGAPFGLPGQAAAAAAAGGIAGSGHAPGGGLKSPGMASLEALQRSGLFGAAYLERMREGQARLAADQERQAAAAVAAQAELLERSSRDRSETSSSGDRRDSLELKEACKEAAAGARPGAADRGGNGASAGGADSPILNLTKADDHHHHHHHQHHQQQQQQQQQLNQQHHHLHRGHKASSSPKHDGLSQSAVAGDERRKRHRSESPVLTDDEDDIKGKKAAVDKVNNNGGTGAAVAAAAAAAAQGPPPNPFSLHGFPANFAAAAAAAAAAGGASAAAAPAEEPSQQLNSVYGIIGNIQALLKMAVENAKQEERNKDRDSEDVDEIKRNSQLYLRRLKKEKRYRRKLQERLQEETKRRLAVMEALRLADAESYQRLSSSHPDKEPASAEENGSSPAAQPPASARERRGGRRSVDVNDADVDDDDDDDDDDGGVDADDVDDDHSSGGSEELDSTLSGAKAKDDVASSSGAEAEASESLGKGGDDDAQITAKVTTKSASSGQAGQRQQQGQQQAANDEQQQSRDPAPTIGFAKNLFPFNGSSLYTSAN